MRALSIFIFILIAHSASSQVLPQYYDTLERNYEFILNGLGDYSASAVRNEITSKFYRGGYIDQDMKDFSFDKHKAVNRIGGVASGELTFINYKKHLFKNKNWGYLVKVGIDYFGGSVYSKDAFGLVFYGNERYFGDTIDLSGTNMSYTGYQKVGFGLIDSKSKSFLNVNVYNISDRFTMNNRDLKVIQSSDSMIVDLIMDGEVEMKDNAKFNQGIGVGFDFAYNLPISWQSGKTSYFQFSAKNIGVGYMYEDQKRYSYDTTFHYEGLTFSQITGENSLLKDSLDVLDTLGITSGYTNSTFLLPGMIQVAKIVDQQNDSKVQSFYGIRMYPTLLYSPYLFAGVDYRPIDWMNLGAMVSYGGFCGFKGGIYASIKKEKYSVGISSENITGAISKKGNGQSINLLVRCVL